MTWETLNRETAQATQDALEARLGMTRDLFGMSCFIGQGNAPAFLTATPADRKAHFGSMLDTARTWPTAFAYAAGLRKAAEAELGTVRIQMQIREEKLQGLPAVNERVAFIEAGYAEGLAAVATAEAFAQLAQDTLTANAAAAERKQRLTTERDHAKTAHERCEVLLSQARSAAKELPALLSHVAALKASAGRVAELEAQREAVRDAMAARDAAVAEKERLALEADRAAEDSLRIGRELDVLRERFTTAGDEARAIERAADHAAPCPTCKRTLDKASSVDAVATLAAAMDRLREDIDAKQQLFHDKARIAIDTGAQAEAVVIPDVPAFGATALSNARTDARDLPAAGHQAQTLGELAAQEPDLDKAAFRAELALTNASALLERASEGVADEQTLQQAVTDARAALQTRRDTLDATTAELVRARQTLEQMQTAEQELAILHSRRNEENERLDVLRVAERAFGRDGVPVLLAEVALPQFEADANEVLRDFPTKTGAWQFRLETQPEQDNGKLREDLYAVATAPDGCEQEYRSLSGGQVSRVAFPVRVALALMLKRTGGASSGLLMIDELEALDDEGHDLLARIIRKLVDDGKFSHVLATSHNPRFLDAFDQRVEIAFERKGAYDESRIVAAVRELVPA